MYVCVFEIRENIYEPSFSSSSKIGEDFKTRDGSVHLILSKKSVPPPQTSSFSFDLCFTRCVDLCARCKPGVNTDNTRSTTTRQQTFHCTSSLRSTPVPHDVSCDCGQQFMYILFVCVCPYPKPGIASYTWHLKQCEVHFNCVCR